MQLATLRLIRARLTFMFLLSMLSFAGTAHATPASGDYQGWLFETGIFSEGVFVEEQCFGELNWPVTSDLNWTVSLADEVCWGRATTSSGRFPINFPPFSVENFEGEQSTRPLVSAGGNLYEAFGEELEMGVGQGEERFGALMSTPSNDNLIMIGGYDIEVDEFVEGYFRFVGLMVKSTSANQAARVAADLEGTKWRIGVYRHELVETNINAEFALTTVLTLDLLPSGLCSYTNSAVFPDFVDNGDVYRAFQFDDGVVFDNRFVRGGPDERDVSNCTWTIDNDKYLSVTRTLTRAADPSNPEVLTTRYVVSDDNHHFTLAPSPSVDDSSRALAVGYRAANGLAGNAINGNYLFYLAFSEFGADGTGAQAAGPFGDRDWQELDVLGRGKVVFDSTTVGTTPAGETGTWYSCDMEAVFGDNEHELTGSTNTASVALGQFTAENENIIFDQCDFQLQADGGLRVYVFEPDGEDPEDDFEKVLRGYVNDNGEILSLAAVTVQGDPQNPSNVNKDLANVLFMLGMEYTGDPNADADGDGITNLREFQIPLPVSNTKDDFDGDGRSDILWREIASTGQNYMYLMDGSAIGSAGSVNVVSDQAWQVAGTGDYNGDSRADVLWRRSDGQIYMYLMNGTSIIGTGSLPLVSTDWQIVGSGDYNGDGKSDILWRNSTTGQNYVYLMNGTAITSALPINTVGTDWEIVGSGDFNNNGSSDILWRNSVTGQNYIYLMNGASIASSLFVNTVGTDWKVVGTGDYNGNGNADILWRNSVTGQNYMYLMNGAAIASSLLVNTVGTDWQVVGDGDYNGDDNADILWRNSVTGQNYMYLMNGASIASSANVNTVSFASWLLVNTP